jgi:hypothetical protein
MCTFSAQSAMTSAGLNDALSPINSLGTLLGINKFRAKWMAAIYCSAIAAFYFLAASITLFPTYPTEGEEIVLENDTIIVSCIAYLHLSIYFQFFIVVRAQCNDNNGDEIFRRLGAVSKSLNAFSAFEKKLKRLSRRTTFLIIVWACTVFALDNLLWLDALENEWIILMDTMVVAVLLMVLQTKLVLAAKMTGFIFKLQNMALLEMSADELLEADIEKHRFIFGQLCDLMRATNECFGPAMVTSFPIGILMILFCAYFLCIGIWNLEPLYAERSNFLAVVEALRLAGMLAHHWSVFHSCEKTVTEVKQNKATFN